VLEGLDELLEGSRARLRDLEDRWARERAPWKLTAGARSAAGTLAALRRSVEERVGPLAGWVTGRVLAAPEGRSWENRSLERRSLEKQRFEVRRAATPSVLLLWTQRVLPETPLDFELSEDDLPPGVHVQAALVGRVPAGRGAVPGERLQGVLFWERVPRGASSESVEDGR
jgi:hypothetical protein